MGKTGRDMALPSALKYQSTGTLQQRLESNDYVALFLILFLESNRLGHGRVKYLMNRRL